MWALSSTATSLTPSTRLSCVRGWRSEPPARFSRRRELHADAPKARQAEQLANRRLRDPARGELGEELLPAHADEALQRDHRIRPGHLPGANLVDGAGRTWIHHKRRRYALIPRRPKKGESWLSTSTSDEIAADGQRSLNRG